jgi:hypothetical protein
MVYVVLVMMVVRLVMIGMVITAQFEYLKVNILSFSCSDIMFASEVSSRETALGTRRA